MTEFEDNEERKTPVDPTVDFAGRHSSPPSPPSPPGEPRASALYAIAGGGQPEEQWTGLAPSGELEYEPGRPAPESTEATPPPAESTGASRQHEVAPARVRSQSEGSAATSRPSPTPTAEEGAVREQMNRTRTLEFPPWLLRLAFMYREGRLSRAGGGDGVRQPRSPSAFAASSRAPVGRTSDAPASGSDEQVREASGGGRGTLPALPRHHTGNRSESVPLGRTAPRTSEVPEKPRSGWEAEASLRSRWVGLGVAVLATAVGLVAIFLGPGAKEHSGAQPEPPTARQDGDHLAAPAMPVGEHLPHPELPEAQDESPDEPSAPLAEPSHPEASAPLAEPSHPEPARAAQAPRAAEWALAAPVRRVELTKAAEGSSPAEPTKAPEGSSPAEPQRRREASEARSGDRGHPAETVCELPGQCGEDGPDEAASPASRQRRLDFERLGKEEPF